MKTLKEVLKNPPLRFKKSIPAQWNIDYDLWCRQVREAVAVIECAECGHPTGRDEVDALYIDDYGPFCIECYAKGIKSMGFASEEVREICQGGGE